MKRCANFKSRTTSHELTNKYVPFAIDNYGNLICFDANNDKIVFVNHEDMSVEIIADNFNDFMNGLYKWNQ